MKKQSDRPFAEELPDLLAERGLSQRKLAQLVNLNPSIFLACFGVLTERVPALTSSAESLKPSTCRPGTSQNCERLLWSRGSETDPKLRDKLYKRLQIEDD